VRLADKVAALAFMAWVVLWLLMTGCDSGQGPRVAWLDYSNGAAVELPQPNPCYFATPTPFSNIDPMTREKVMALLVDWHKGFDIRFTEDRPSYPGYDVVVISNDSAWCKQADNIGGLAPWAGGADIGGTSHAFDGWSTANVVAQTIAQEHAHVLGLPHSTVPGDVMNPVVTNVATGFLGASHGQMMAALGPSW
jgi:hypothetical protein